MLEWLESFGNFLIGIGDFLVSFFTNVIEVVVYVFKGFAFASTVITYMPVQYQVALQVSIAFIVIVTIIHFGG